MGAGLTYESLNALSLWRDISCITLEEMRGVRLMNRIDTKYVLSEMEVLALLERAAKEGYRVQVVGGCYAQRYDTLYFDTAQRAMYLEHHNRQLRRQKLRTRTYVDGGQSFFEIKSKSNRGRTVKRRVAIPQHCFSDFALDTEALSLFREHSWYDLGDLSPALSTSFVRVTLVDRGLAERLTIDMDLQYEDVRSGSKANVAGMAIVELKQDGRTASTMKGILCDMRIPPLKVSKYCLGTSLTVEGIKKNRFKLKLRNIHKRLKINELK